MPGYGMYLFNPGKRKKSRRKIRRSKARRKASGRFAKSNPTMKKSRRRRKARSALRNPSRRRRSRRARVARRNPARRRRRARMARRNPARRRRRGGLFSRRNPGSGIIAEFTSQDMLTAAGGVIVGGIGATLIVDKLSKPGTMLPGLDPAKPTAYGRTIWKAVIAGGAGFLLRGKAPRFAEGLMLSAVAMVGNDVLVQSGIVGQIRTAAGVSRYYGARPGAGMLPGTSTRFTGPAQRFLTRNNAPRPRGMGAVVGPGFVRRTASASEGAFTGAN